MELRPKANFSYMLAGMTLFLVLGPVAEYLFGTADGAVLMLSYTTMLVIGIWSLHQTKMLFNLGLTLATFCVGLTLVDLALDEIDLGLYLMGALLVFQLMSILIAFRYVFASGSISLNRLMGGVCLYLLLGLTWNIFYVYLFEIDPTNFVGISEETVANSNVYWDMTYFSFVTLTTLGYGDIQPVGAIAKVLAYSEAVVGELYIAVLIGALVGNYISERDAKRN
jgi:voltage-gated potassium channel